LQANRRAVQCKRVYFLISFWNARSEKAFYSTTRSYPMRRHIAQAVLATIFAVTIAGSISPAAAQGRIQDQFCLQGRSWGYPGNCQFSSYRQCMAAASGTNAYCGINPLYASADQRRGYRGRY
jgi:Protein of unknown function (DUF3551)